MTFPICPDCAEFSSLLIRQLTDLLQIENKSANNAPKGKCKTAAGQKKKGSAIQNSLCILLLPLERKRDSNTGSERERTKDAIIKIKPATNLRNQLEIIYMFIRN